MEQRDHQIDVPAPASRLAMPVALWGGGAGLLAIAVAYSRGVSESASLGVITVAAAALAGFGLLVSLRPRPMCRWAMPLLLVQMVRTMLAPSIGLAVFLLSGVDAVGFWLSLLAVASAMLVGETIAVSRMFGAGQACRADVGEVAA